MKVKAADIDFELARSYVNAGQIDRAEPLFLRARDEGEPTAEVTVELANLALKRGDPRRAAPDRPRRARRAARRAELDARHDRLRRGARPSRAACSATATDAAGDHSGAEASWRSALIGWERLMIEHLRRKNLGESAEAAVEVGRLLYLLGRHSEGLQKFDEAIEEDGDRDQTYIDVIAFLVQHGETDAALSVYHRALSRPGRAVSEYVKVYTSLWVLDLSRRTSKLGRREGETRSCARSTDATAICARAAAPPGTALLAKFAVGQLSYDQMLAAADTTGKRAEIYFYEGMRRLGRRQVRRRARALAEGRRDAHVLVLRVRHGVALPAGRRADGAHDAGHARRDSDRNDLTLTRPSPVAAALARPASRPSPEAVTLARCPHPALPQAALARPPYPGPLPQAGEGGLSWSPLLLAGEG